MIKCSNCGKNVSEYAVVCPNCGHKISCKSYSTDTYRSTKKRISIGRKTKVTVGVSAIALMISTFIFICARNAHNAWLGISVLGLGSIFFERDVIEGSITTIVIVEACAGAISFACVAVLVICFVALFRSRSKNIDK